MIKILFIALTFTFSLFSQQLKHEEAAYTHKHKPCICDKPVVFDETPMEKIFELKGKIYKVLKGDDTNPSILYVLDTKTDKFVRIKQQ